MTPTRAIKAKCLRCINRDKFDPDLCATPECFFRPFRFPNGKKPRPLKTIRKFCLDCGDGGPADVRNCPIVDCPLHQFRMGHNPSRRGRVNAPALQKSIVSQGVYATNFSAEGKSL